MKVKFQTFRRWHFRIWKDCKYLKPSLIPSRMAEYLFMAKVVGVLDIAVGTQQDDPVFSSWTHPVFHSSSDFCVIFELDQLDDLLVYLLADLSPTIGSKGTYPRLSTHWLNLFSTCKLHYLRCFFWMQSSSPKHYSWFRQRLRLWWCCIFMLAKHQTYAVNVCAVWCLPNTHSCEKHIHSQVFLKFFFSHDSAHSTHMEFLWIIDNFAVPLT